MTDVQPPTPPDQGTTSRTPSGLGWPMGHVPETSIDVSRETSMIQADVGWPE